MQNGLMFSRLMEECGSQERPEEEEAAPQVDKVKSMKRKDSLVQGDPEAKPTLAPQALMLDEERYVGYVSWSVYSCCRS